MTDRFAWIDAGPTNDADRAELARVYQRLQVPPDGTGFDHVLKIHGPMPATLEEHLAFYRGILRRPGPLTRVECEVVGVAVSKRNGCHY